MTFGAVALIALGIGACGSGNPSGFIARTGTSVVTAADLDRVVGALKAAGNQPGVSRSKIEGEALGLLISAQWTEAEAAKLGLDVSAAEVRHQLELFKFDSLENVVYKPGVRNTQLARLLSAPGVPDSSQLWALKVSLLEHQIEQRRIAGVAARLTHEQLEVYYREHQPRYFIPELRTVEIVETYKPRPMAQAVKEIRAGKTFKEVAKRWTIDPEAPEGIRHHYHYSQGLRALAAAIFAAKIGQLIGPKLLKAYYIFKVTKIYPAHEAPLSQVKNRVRRELAEHINSTQLTTEAKHHWATQTYCANSRLATTCQRYSSHALRAG